MILFDYECPHCRKTEEKLVGNADEPVTCGCGTRMKKLISTRGGGIDWFKPGMVFEDIASKPIKVESKKHLKDVCEKHGCYSIALLNEKKSSGAAQEVHSNSDMAWRKVRERNRTREVANENYRKFFGDT